MPKFEIYQNKYRKFVVDAKSFAAAAELDLSILTPEWETGWETEDMQKIGQAIRRRCLNHPQDE
jgi:hypothetical protein